MSERYYSEYGLIIDRTKIGIEENVSVFDEDFGTIDDICELLNKQDQRIAELEEQLKNSRIKYFIGLDGMDFDICVKEMDLNIILPQWMHDKDFKFYDTKEEAQAKLKELQGE